MSNADSLQSIPQLAVLRGEDGNDLRLVVKGRTNPDAATADDREWLACDILMNCSMARGSSSATLLIADLQEAIERIKNLEVPSAGVLLLESIDDDITVVVDVPKPEAVQAQVTVSAPDAVLEYFIACSVPALEAFRADLEKIVTRYLV